METTTRADELDAAFEVRIGRHPWVLAAFIRIALELMDPAGRIRVGRAWETLRDQVKAADGGKYSLDNNYRSRLARPAMATEPRLAGRMEIRRLSDAVTAVQLSNDQVVRFGQAVKRPAWQAE